MERAQKGDGAFAARGRLGELLQEEEVLGSGVGGVLQVLAQFVEDEQQAAGARGGGFGEQAGALGARGAGPTGEGQRAAADPLRAGLDAGFRSGFGSGLGIRLRERLGEGRGDRRDQRGGFRLEQQRTERGGLRREVLGAQASRFLVPRPGAGEQVGEEEQEGGLAGAVGAGERPGARSGVSAVRRGEFLEDLPGGLPDGLGDHIAAGRAAVVPVAPVARQVDRAVESPGQVDQVAQRPPAEALDRGGLGRPAGPGSRGAHRSR